MVATVQQANNAKNASPQKKAGQKLTPPKPDKKNDGSDRKKAEGLAGTVGKTLENATTAVVGAGADVVKESAKSGLSSVVKNLVYPLRMQLSIPPLSFAVGPISKFITGQLDKYIQENNIDIAMQPSAIVHELLFGDIDKLSSEVTDLLGDFWQKSIPAELKSAIESKSPTKIALATGTSLTSGAKGLFSQMFNMPNSNKFTSLFKFAGQKIPFVNRLSPKFQPWAAGAGVFMFGGLAIRLMMKAAKLLVGGTLLATGGVFAKKIFDKATKPAAGGMMPGAKAPGAMGGAMNMLSGLAGGGGGMPGIPGAAAGKPGMGNMMNAASGLMSMLGGRK